MFKWRIIPKTIKNRKKGFSITRKLFKGNQLIYKEDKRSITLFYTRYTTQAYMVVGVGYPNEKWDPPFDSVKITKEDWIRIGRNIKQAYESKKIDVEIEFMTIENYEAFKLWAIKEVKI